MFPLSFSLGLADWANFIAILKAVKKIMWLFPKWIVLQNAFYGYSIVRLDKRFLLKFWSMHVITLIDKEKYVNYFTFHSLN